MCLVGLIYVLFGVYCRWVWCLFSYCCSVVVIIWLLVVMSVLFWNSSGSWWCCYGGSLCCCSRFLSVCEWVWLGNWMCLLFCCVWIWIGVGRCVVLSSVNWLLLGSVSIVCLF